MSRFIYVLKNLVPKKLYALITRPYHFAMAFLGALLYGFPSRKLTVIGITGTKGKSSTAELINAILEEAGKTTALSSTIRFKIAGNSKPNLFKMTMPGRFFLQRFLHDAAKAGCTYAIIEMTSEGVLQSRHMWIDLDVLVFTNIAHEHIEAHGSFKNYLAAKLTLRDALERSPKKRKRVAANIDDKYGEKFLEISDAQQLPYSLRDAEPYSTNSRGVLITVDGESIHSSLLGVFNIYNILAAVTVAKSENVRLETIKRALERLEMIAGRAERVEAGQNFTVVVDYAHTPDSLRELYRAFTETSSKKSRLICILGNTGGGRDRFKRPLMGEIADKHCDVIILTNEDPYDEDPRAIVKEMAVGITEHEPLIIMDRRLAIREALEQAEKYDVVLISGKGTDPYIMGPKGTKTRWSDKRVATEEIKKLSKEPARAVSNTTP